MEIIYKVLTGSVHHCLIEECVEIHIKSTKGPVDVFLCGAEQGSADEKSFEILTKTVKMEPVSEGFLVVCEHDHTDLFTVQICLSQVVYRR
ncbi:unnamed protein product [Ranitomeya imitator]|uniref:Recombination activating protein 2 n=1 Tax=Ranitomeya imitator TaxID=111125 RepID=A0ABN9L5C6_9NEOB|nr:unnamed protein product [Ranitomeya imitator]